VEGVRSSLITNPDGPRFQIDNFFLLETYAAAFADTGFDASHGKTSRSRTPAGSGFPDDYWYAMLTEPPIVGMREEIVGRGERGAFRWAPRHRAGHKLLPESWTRLSLES
jgi:hypothetical protein